VSHPGGADAETLAVAEAGTGIGAGGKGRGQQPWGREMEEEDEEVVLVLARGWQELWRPGNCAGAQPRIAEGAAQGVDQWEGGE
jgi:hypothetical protein